MDLSKLLESIQDDESFTTVTEKLRYKSRKLDIGLNSSTVDALAKIQSLEIKYFRTHYAKGAAILAYELLLELPPSRTSRFMEKPLVKVLAYWLQSVVNHLIVLDVQWWSFVNTILNLIRLQHVRCKAYKISLDTFVQECSAGLLEIATHKATHAVQAHQILSTLNLCLTESSQTVRYDLAEPLKQLLLKLSPIMAMCGHYPLQSSALMCYLKFLNRNDKLARVFAAKTWLPLTKFNPDVISIFTRKTFREFNAEQDSREFLNTLNASSDRVISVKFDKLTPEIPNAKNYWVDLNACTSCLSINFYDYTDRVAQWNTIAVTADNAISVTLARVQSQQIAIRITTKEPAQIVLPSTTVFTANTLEVQLLQGCNLSKVNKGLRIVFGDKYQVRAEIEDEIIRTESKRRRKNTGEMRANTNQASFNSPSSVSTSSLAQLPEKLAGLIPRAFDRKMSPIQRAPEFSSVVEDSNEEICDSFETESVATRLIKPKTFGVMSHLKEQAHRQSLSDDSFQTRRKHISVEMTQSDNDSRIRNVTVKLIRDARIPAIANDHNRQAADDCQESERTHDSNMIRIDSGIMDLLVLEALGANSQGNDSGVITGHQHDDDVIPPTVETVEVNSKMSKNVISHVVPPVNKTTQKSPVYSVKACSVPVERMPLNIINKWSNAGEKKHVNTQKSLNSATSDESSTSAISNTPVPYVNVRKRSLRAREPAETIDEDNEILEAQAVEDVFTSNFNDVACEKIFPTRTRQINVTSSDSSFQLEACLISNLDSNLNFEQFKSSNIDKDVWECVANIVDKVCAIDKLVLEQVIQSTESDSRRTTDTSAQKNISKNFAPRIRRKRKYSAKTQLSPKDNKIHEDVDPDSSNHQPLTSAKRGRPKKCVDKPKKPVLKIKFQNQPNKNANPAKTSKMNEVITQKVEQSTESDSRRTTTDTSTDKNTSNKYTPRVRQKRKLYSPKDDDIDDVNSDSSSEQPLTSIRNLQSKATQNKDNKIHEDVDPDSSNHQPLTSAKRGRPKKCVDKPKKPVLKIKFQNQPNKNANPAKTSKMNEVITQKVEQSTESDSRRTTTDTSTDKNTSNKYTPRVRQKRKLYSPKDDDIDDVNSDSSSEQPLTSIRNLQSKATQNKDQTKRHSPKTPSFRTCYEDIEKDRIKFGIRTRRLSKSLTSKPSDILSPKTNKMNELFDRLKSNIEGAEQIKYIDKKLGKDLAVFNFTSDSEDEEFTKKKIELQKKISKSTLASKSSGTIRRGKLPKEDKNEKKATAKKGRNISNNPRASCSHTKPVTKKPAKGKSPAKRSASCASKVQMEVLEDERMRNAHQEDLNTSLIIENPLNKSHEDLNPNTNKPVLEVEDDIKTVKSKVKKPSNKKDEIKLDEVGHANTSGSEHTLKSGRKRLKMPQIDVPQDDSEGSVSPLPELVVETFKSNPHPRRYDADDSGLSTRLMQKITQICNNQNTDDGKHTTQNLLLDDDGKLGNENDVDDANPERVDEETDAHLTFSATKKKSLTLKKVMPHKYDREKHSVAIVSKQQSPRRSEFDEILCLDEEAISSQFKETYFDMQHNNSASNKNITVRNKNKPIDNESDLDSGKLIPTSHDDFNETTTELKRLREKTERNTDNSKESYDKTAVTPRKRRSPDKNTEIMSNEVQGDEIHLSNSADSHLNQPFFKYIPSPRYCNSGNESSSNHTNTNVLGHINYILKNIATSFDENHNISERESGTSLLSSGQTIQSLEPKKPKNKDQYTNRKSIISPIIDLTDSDQESSNDDVRKPQHKTLVQCDTESSFNSNATCPTVISKPKLKMKKITETDSIMNNEMKTSAAFPKNTSDKCAQKSPETTPGPSNIIGNRIFLSAPRNSNTGENSKKSGKIKILSNVEIIPTKTRKEPLSPESRQIINDLLGRSVTIPVSRPIPEDRPDTQKGTPPNIILAKKAAPEIYQEGAPSKIILAKKDAPEIDTRTHTEMAKKHPVKRAILSGIEQNPKRTKTFNDTVSPSLRTDIDIERWLENCEQVANPDCATMEEKYNEVVKMIDSKFDDIQEKLMDTVRRTKEEIKDSVRQTLFTKK